MSDPDHRHASYQQVIQSAVDAGLAGIQMRVHDEHGDWVGSAGVRALGSTEAPPVDGRFWVGSATKPFTATVLLQLIAERTTTLDAPVADALPEWELDPRITARTLLQHTSGLYNYTGELDGNGQFVPGIAATGTAWVQDRFRSYRPEELMRVALSQPPRFEPGTDQSYANSNYTLAALLIERLTGRTYAQELQRRILAPLGLNDTVVPGDLSDLPTPHAHGYYRHQDGDRWAVTDVSRQNLSLLIGAGDLISTTRDLQTFISALLTGQLLPEALLTEMCTLHGKLGLGLGLWVQDLGADGGIILHHNGGAPGGYGALMIGTPNATRTMTAGLTTGDAAIDLAQVFPQVLGALIAAVFARRYGDGAP